VEDDSTFGFGKEAFVLDYLTATSGIEIIPTATVRILKNDYRKKAKPIILQETAHGCGPVEATYKAIDKIVNMDIKLNDFSLRSLSSGEDAQGEVVLKLKYKGMLYSGKGISTDIVEASAKAYMQAINKAVLISEQRTSQQAEDCIS